MNSPQLSQDVNTSVVEETPLSNQMFDPSEVEYEEIPLELYSVYFLAIRTKAVHAKL